MRRGYDNEIMTAEDGKLLLFNLGSDFCGEHEWGIKDIVRDFGIKKKLTKRNIGIRRHAITQVPENRLFLFEKGDEAILYYGSAALYRNDAFNFEAAKRCLREDYKDDFYTGWSGSDFGIRVKGAEKIAKLKELYEAFIAKDVAIWIGGSGVFKNGGLMLAVKSNLSKEHLNMLKDADTDTLKLNDASDKTGIIKRLDKVNKDSGAEWRWDQPCAYMCCSPAWLINKDEDDLEARMKERGTEHPVIYWLNPHNQRKVNFGWFTVEELDQWIAGTGPIPKKEGE
jgi:hypothetical protein